jgi:uncharacterized protein YdeI (YjbR/CyaY-like superfamily)
MEKDTETFSPQNSQEWRKWLEENHIIKNAIWLIYYKKKSKIPSIEYNDAVDQALCFGWIDSKSKPIDDEKYMQFFSKRKPKSVWSKINKNKIERLTAEGQMAQAGLDIIQIAKENGSWFILDDAESLIIPQDLSIELEKNPVAQDFFINLSRSNKRNLLQWLVLAKRAETRQNRIKEIVDLANLGRKPKQFG